MDYPAIRALQTALPETCYSQEDIASFYARLLAHHGKPRERAIRAIFDRSGVAFRRSVVAPTYFEQARSTQERNDLYMEEAVKLGEIVLRRGLKSAGVAPEAVASFTVVSCTGFSIPGLDLLLAGRLGMRSDLSRTCVLGMGCYGAFPGMRRALESVSAHPDQLALVLALELCTLHLQFDDAAESVVSASLFGDGAAMLVVGGVQAEPQATGARLIDAETFCDYATLDHMSFTVTDEGFRMYLSSYVADVLAANVRAFVERLLARNGLRREGVKLWGIHPGSKKIVEYVQAQLELSDTQVQCSLDVLRDYGNMSSATVLFVLERMIQTGVPHPGDYGVIMAFGPGLTMEALLLQW